MDNLRQHPMWDEQRRLESEMVGVQRYQDKIRRAVERGEETSKPSVRELLKSAIQPTADAVKAFVDEARIGSGGLGAPAKVLSLFEGRYEIPAYLAAKIVFDQISKPQSLQSIAIKVGFAVEDQLRLEAYRTQNHVAFDSVVQDQRKRKKGRHHFEYALRSIMERRGATFEGWPKSILFQVGVVLIELFEQAQGVIQVADRPRKGNRPQARSITPTDKTAAFLEATDKERELMYPTYMPMVVPPRPWKSPRGGGYYHTGKEGFTQRPLKLVRTPFETHFNYVSDLAALQMPNVYEAVNAVQETAWQINERVLAVMREAWDTDVAVGGLPSQAEIPVPSAPVPYIKDSPQVRAWADQADQVRTANVIRRLHCIEVTKCVMVAEKYRKYEAIYFPHQLDFRGRVYPVPIYLHPQDADFSRALLHFSEAKPLGKDGAFWLAVHGANTYGFDKVDLKSRVKWVAENEAAILRSAEDPLAERWWADADKPWQFLAFCIEWQGYKREGESFASRLPVALDGTCNGLQHFSAMLRDEKGGTAVNLCPTEQPQDIYQRVADRVTDKLMSSADPMAGPWLAFGIDRKITKRSVMILPYGGTFHACRDYVGQAVLEKIRHGTPNPFEGRSLTFPIMFLAKLVWESIGGEVAKAQEAMTWLQKIARALSKAKHPVSWFTPAGFYAMQLYPELEHYRVKTFLHGQMQKYWLVDPKDDTIDADDQFTGIAPNFVHSMDGSALMMTVINAKRAGVNAFAMVHDSYGTHAANTAVLGQMLRGAFVHMYKTHDPLEEIRARAIEVVGEAAIPPVPAKGSLDIDGVHKSRFFFA